MEHTCANCRYYELDATESPCLECVNGCVRSSRWAPRIDSLYDISDKIDALSEELMYIRQELVRLHNELKKEH